MQNGKERKGKDTKGKGPRGKDSEGKDPNGKDRKGKSIRGKKRIWGEKKLSLVREDKMPPSIILRLRHGGRIGHRLALGMNGIIENTSARRAIGISKMDQGAKCEIRRMKKSK